MEPVPDWTASDYLRDSKFEHLATRRVALRQWQLKIEGELKTLNMEMAALLAAADLQSVRYTSFRFTLGHAMKGGKLSKELLLEAGVTVEQLERGTTPRELGDPYVSITELKS